MKKTKKILSYIFIVLFAFSICTKTVSALNIADGLVLFDDVSCEGVLGSPTDEASTAYLLQQIFTVMKFAAPVLVLAFSVMDFIKAVTSQDKDMLAKATKRTLIRFIIGLIVFVVPYILDFAFELFGWYGTCGIK